MRLSSSRQAPVKRVASAQRARRDVSGGPCPGAPPYNEASRYSCRLWSVRSTLFSKILAILAGLLLTCELSGCAAPRAPAGGCALGAHAMPDAEPAVPWWNGAGDTLLARLVDDGLAADARLRDEAAALAGSEFQALHWKYRVRDWLGSLLGYPARDPAARALRLADARQRKAAAIALDYVSVRRLQSVLALRQRFQDQFRDNADIARWRREAGLVTTVDGGLAAAMVGVNAGALDATRERLAAARAALAREAGVAGELLDEAMDDGAQVPELTMAAVPERARGDARVQRDRAALADAESRQRALRDVERNAELTVVDARAAYRLGTANFATLYAAEAAALAAREAGIDARADRADAVIRLGTDAGLVLNRAARQGVAGRSSAAATRGGCNGG